MAVETVRATAREPERLHADTATYAGLFCVTLSTLMLEIALTRIFSVTMWYHFAFVAISVALFGLTFGALTVHLLPRRFPDVLVKQRLWLAALLFGLSIPICLDRAARDPVHAAPHGRRHRVGGRDVRRSSRSRSC